MSYAYIYIYAYDTRNTKFFVSHVVVIDIRFRYLPGWHLYLTRAYLFFPKHGSPNRADEASIRHSCRPWHCFMRAILLDSRESQLVFIAWFVGQICVLVRPKKTLRISTTVGYIPSLMQLIVAFCESHTVMLCSSDEGI